MTSCDSAQSGFLGFSRACRDPSGWTHVPTSEYTDKHAILGYSNSIEYLAILMVDIHQRIHRIEVYPSARPFKAFTNIIPKVKTIKHFDAQIFIHLANHLDRIRRMHMYILPISVCSDSRGPHASFGDEDLAVCFEEDGRVLDL